MRGSHHHHHHGMASMIVVFVGTAGSGKTTLTGEFGRYLEDNYKVAYVNLDTGVKELPYEPSIDVREFVTVEEIMREGYGPNGAIVESYDRLMEKFNEYLNKILRLEKENDYVLIDTPGQMETFLFHEFGVRLMENLPYPLVVYISDPEILKKPNDYCFVRFFALLIDLRLGATTIPALNKVDLLSEEEKERHRKYFEDIDYLTARLKLDPSMQGLMAYKMCSMMTEVLPPVRVLYLSAKTREGFEDLETLAYEHYCTCGDLT
nr:Chain A, ATP(GTP)binding protein [Pyrococcus abyssi]1YR7_A Chain A, ATP(GTP)binding protein [Pyrococcus abyssi]1YR8_A Chain A, ATP(GTP)binding protein [Pyrococcus abyssi]1YR9_A Chain A, ATP(GTP)binding protein [Pyrococcus abyssi]1YRA_A Chain A, ATP(GTP)binding protein [Pyrococcus abyssi]1YRA_B Chain B, ATP(GTP)binding protein [Pyrococcus abyssi]1YRB_A Chain A, ATP(GTP)binding protein [Pyrococcus abyssi]1YRB_B Chain B, ATP(GTP)binding protein [Pyrococcus abyssi]2OXR_A Chain A, ATP(GTP)bin